MRSFLLIAIASSLLAVGCQGKSDSSAAPKDTAQVKSMTTVDERTTKIEALKKMPTIPMDKLQGLMPKDIDGVKQTNFSYDMQWGYGYATADFDKTKAEGIKVTFYDCSGPEGSTYYAGNFYDKLNQDKQDSSEYSKTIDLMGAKAIEFYNKDVNYSTLTYMVGDNLLVQLQGKKKKPEDLKAVAQKLNLKL